MVLLHTLPYPKQDLNLDKPRMAFFEYCQATALTTRPPWPVINLSFVTLIFFFGTYWITRLIFEVNARKKHENVIGYFFWKKAIEAFLHIPSNMQIKFLFPTNISCKLLSSAIFKFVFEGIAFHKMAFQCF